MPCTIFDATWPLFGLAISGQHGRKQREECSAEADQQVGANASRPALVFALETDHSAQNGCGKQRGNGAIENRHLLKPAEVERRRNAASVVLMALTLADAITAPQLCTMGGVSET